MMNIVSKHTGLEEHKRCVDGADQEETDVELDEAEGVSA